MKACGDPLLLEQIDIDRVQAVIERLVERARFDTHQERHRSGADHLAACVGRIQPFQQLALLGRRQRVDILDDDG